MPIIGQFVVSFIISEYWQHFGICVFQLLMFLYFLSKEDEVGVGPHGMKQGWHQPPPFVKKEDVPPFQPEGYQYFPKGFDVSIGHPSAPGSLGSPVDSLGWFWFLVT